MFVPPATTGYVSQVIELIKDSPTPTTFDEFLEFNAFMVDPVSTWSRTHWLIFPWLFIIPAEMLGLISSALIYLMGNPKTDLPYGRTTGKEIEYKPDWLYIWFNRLLVLPFLSWMIVRCVWDSPAVVYGGMEKATFMNSGVAFLIVFSLSDLTYYIGHRVVHKYPFLYKNIHKHHHGEAEPIRGWSETCNAHPLDFFYTGFCTSPLSVMWLMPLIGVEIHIYAIAACLWLNSFVGSLGHCRLDLNVGVFNTRFHAGHHANSTCNFAQNIEIWDRLFGTYRDYSATVDRKRALLRRSSGSSEEAASSARSTGVSSGVSSSSEEGGVKKQE